MSRRRRELEQTEEPVEVQDLAPGSSRRQDALVGPLDREEALRIARKRLWPYKVAHWLLRAPIRWWLRVKREGHRNVPKRDGAILVMNHVSSFDPPVLLVSLRRPFVTLAKAGIMAKPIKRLFVETLGGMIRVDRSRRGNQAAVEAACAAVENGKLLAVWPEGGRSPTGRLSRGRTGVARIALKTGAPVIPVAVMGTYRLKSKHARKIRWGTPVRIRFGEPRRFVGREHEAEDREVVRAVTDELMMEVARLLGPEEEAHLRMLIERDVPPGQVAHPDEEVADGPTGSNEPPDETRQDQMHVSGFASQR